MIDLAKETLLSLSQAGRRIPSSRIDRQVNPSTVWRWVRTGCRAADGRIIKLESVRLGGRWLVSAESLQRFAEKLACEPVEQGAPLSVRTPGKRQVASERAEKKLEELGI